MSEQQRPLNEWELVRSLTGGAKRLRSQVAKTLGLRTGIELRIPLAREASPTLRCVACTGAGCDLSYSVPAYGTLVTYGVHKRCIENDLTLPFFVNGEPVFEPSKEGP